MSSQNYQKEYIDKYAKGSHSNSTNTTYASPITSTQPVIISDQTSVYNGQSSVPNDYAFSNQTFQSEGYSNITQQRFIQKVVAEEIPTQSRIQYIPFEKKCIEYDQIQRIQRVPYETQIVEYEEVIRTERVPVQRIITDYYAIETQIEYIPKQIEQTVIQYEPVERISERIQYLPVETQFIYFPQRDHYAAGQGQYAQSGYIETLEGYGSNYIPEGQIYGYQTGNVHLSGSVTQEYQSTIKQTSTYTNSTIKQTATYTNEPAYTGQTYVAGQTYATGGSGVRGDNAFRQSQTRYIAGGSGVRK